MRILSLNSSSDLGGLERFQLAVARGLTRLGHHVVLAGRRGSPFLREGRSAGLAAREVDFHRYIAPVGVARLARILRAGSFQTLHYCLSRNIWAATPAAQLAGLKGRVVHSLQMTPGGRLDNPVHRWLRRGLGAFVAPTPRTAEQAARVWGMRPDEVTVIPNFVPLAPFRAPSVAGEARAMRTAWGIGEDALVVGMLARLEPRKGVAEFAEAARLTLSRFPEAHFVAAGPVSEGAESWMEGIREVMAREETAGRFHLPGPQDRVPAFMRALDLFVMPSHGETFGLVLVEAMLSGLPAVAFSGPGPDFILEEDAGVVLDSRDAGALAQELGGLLSDAERRSALGRRGRRRAETTFSDEAVLPRYETLFQRLVASD